MNKYLVCMLFFILFSVTSCLFDEEDEEWSASKVCPEAGTNRYGMPNRGTFVDERDGRVYKYTTIGDQVWMAENLKFELPYPYSSCYGMEYCVFRQRWEGDPVGETVCRRDTAHLAEIAQKMQSTCSDQDCIAQEYCEIYGRFYSLKDESADYWRLDYDVVDSVCPHGWHVPSKAEWEVLIDAVDENGTVLWTADTVWSKHVLKPRNENEYGKDECGFSLVSGFDSADFLTSTLQSDRYSYYVTIWYSIAIGPSRHNNPLRCIKD